MAIFGPKAWINPFKKISIFRLFELLVFIAQKGVVSFQNIVKDIFLPYISLTKNVEEMAIFGPKQWVNHFEKISFFYFLKFLFIAQKSVVSFQNIVKNIFLAYIAQKKKEKWPFQDPLEQSQFFDFLNFWFLQPRKTLFRSRIQ